MKAEVTKDMTIMQAISIDEGIADILLKSGMHCLGCALAHGETVGEAAEVHGNDPQALVDEINAYLAAK